MADLLAELRTVVDSTPAPPPGLDAYLDRVRTRAYTITDAEVAALKEAGFSEDEIFEQTVAAAMSEGLRRFDAAQRVLG